jgi:hypothetical protein
MESGSYYKLIVWRVTRSFLVTSIKIYVQAGCHDEL